MKGLRNLSLADFLGVLLLAGTMTGALAGSSFSAVPEPDSNGDRSLISKCWEDVNGIPDRSLSAARINCLSWDVLEKKYGRVNTVTGPDGYLYWADFHIVDREQNFLYAQFALEVFTQDAAGKIKYGHKDKLVLDSAYVEFDRPEVDGDIPAEEVLAALRQAVSAMADIPFQWPSGEAPANLYRNRPPLEE